MGENDPRWRDLTERYAACVRQFSDSVAHLGELGDVGPETLSRWKRVKELQALCEPVAEEIDRHLRMHRWRLESDSAYEDAKRG